MRYLRVWLGTGGRRNPGIAALATWRAWAIREATAPLRSLFVRPAIRGVSVSTYSLLPRPAHDRRRPVALDQLRSSGGCSVLRVRIGPDPVAATIPSDSYEPTAKPPCTACAPSALAASVRLQRLLATGGRRPSPWGEHPGIHHRGRCGRRGGGRPELGVCHPKRTIFMRSRCRPAGARCMARKPLSTAEIVRHRAEPGHRLRRSKRAWDTTMRCILGLDYPDAGTVRATAATTGRDLGYPMREAGALLDAKAVHGGLVGLQPPAR